MKLNRTERLDSYLLIIFYDIWDMFIENWDLSDNSGGILVVFEKLLKSKSDVSLYNVSQINQV